MKNLKNTVIIITPCFLYWLFVCGAVSIAWHFLTGNIDFSVYLGGLISLRDIFTQIPHFVVYFIFGIIISILIDSKKDYQWIIAFCAFGMIIQLFCFQYSGHFSGELLFVIGRYFPVLSTPWAAFLGYLYISKIKNRKNQNISLHQTTDGGAILTKKQKI